MTPRKIGRYEIKSELGRGGMAIVYQAHDPRFKRDVAVKVLPREFLYDSKFHARFEREAQAIASLEHQAIVPVHDFGEDEGQPFLVMRYMPGGSLADRIKGGPLSFQEAERIITHLAPALDEAHAKGIIHRDLKPGNILFDQHGNPYLSDFGIVKIAEATASLTGTGIIGTPAYMSPEQVVGDKELDNRSDIYALGVILYQMLTGKLPYEADTPIRLALKHVNEPVPDIRDLKPDLPAVCDEVIVRAMAKDADERYQTAGELAKAFSSRVDEKPEAWPAEAAVQDDTPTAILEVPQQHPLPPEEPRLQPEADVQVSPDAVPHIAEPVVPEIEAKRRGLPTWEVIGGVLAVLLLVGGVGGALIKRSQDAKVTQTVVAMAAAKTRSVAETETARPTETPTATITHTPSPTMKPTMTMTLTPTLSPSTTLVSEVDGMLMVYVPEGSFLMGSTIDDQYAESDEFPQHEVYLDAFWIDKTEVTNAQYRQCVEEGACQEPTTCSFGLYNYGDETKWDHPAACVDWYGAVTYCEWAGRRLPTEAEWEKAARGEDGRIYPWGDETPNCTLANYSGCVGGASEVSTYPYGASPYGALDMAGNVWDWVADWYDIDYYENSPKENPPGPSSGDYCVLRGGSWYNNPNCVRTAFRNMENPTVSSSNMGFRCARDDSP